MMKKLTDNVLKPPKRRITSLLESYLELTKNLEVPIEFKRVALLHAVSAAVGRQISWKTIYGTTYPNIYSLVVGIPGSGKSEAVSSITEILYPLIVENKIHKASTNLTKASLIDQLRRAERSFKTLSSSRGSGEDANTYRHLNVFSSELGTLSDAYDPKLLSTLSTLYDNEREFVEEKRDKKNIERDANGDKQHAIVIKNPMVSFLSGTQPKYMVEHVPITAWEQGFATRVWFEYISGGVERATSLFAVKEEMAELTGEVVRELERLTLIEGEMKFDTGAMKALDHFYLVEDKQTRHSHTLLTGFNERRALKLQKMVVLYALCNREELIVTEEDVTQMLEWMYDAERRLLSMFDVIGSSADAEIIRAIYDFVNGRFERFKLGTSKADLRVFIANRGDVHKTQKYIDELIAMEALVLNYAKIGSAIDKTREVYYPKAGFSWTF